jgi:hypothetical protein
VAQCLGHLQCQNDQSNCFKIWMVATMRPLGIATQFMF